MAKSHQIPINTAELVWVVTRRSPGPAGSPSTCSTPKCRPAAALPDDVGDRAGHSDRGPSTRVAGGGRRLSVDHQRTRGGAGRPGWQDRNGHQDRSGITAGTVRRCDLRPCAIGDCGHPRRSVAGSRAARVPTVSAGARRVQGRLRPWKAVSRGPTRKLAAPAPYTWSVLSPSWPSSERDIHAGRMPERP